MSTIKFLDDMITLDQLLVLTTLHNTGSFNKAAESLNRAQSGISYSIKNLEAELNLTLLDRSGYRAKLTRAGEAVLRKANKILEMTHELDELTSNLNEGREPRLDVLIHGILPISNLMPLLKESLKENPSTQVVLRVEILGGVLENIDTLKPDLVVTPLGLFPVPKEYDVIDLGTVSQIPVVSPDHPLAKFRQPIPMHELRKHLHLIVSDSSVARRPLNYGLIGAEECWYFPDFFSRREGLRAGLGFAWMTTYMVEKDIREKRLIPIVVEGQNIQEYGVGVLFRHTPGLGPTGRFLLDLFKRSTGILPPTPKDILSRYHAD